MGQAKQRGTLVERKAAAIEKQTAERILKRKQTIVKNVKTSAILAAALLVGAASYTYLGKHL